MKVNAFLVMGVNPHPEDRVKFRRIYKMLRREYDLSPAEANSVLLEAMLGVPHSVCEVDRGG